MPQPAIKPNRIDATALDRAGTAGLQHLLDAAEDAVSPDQVGICACLYQTSLFSSDPGSFDRQIVWEHRGAEQIYPASVCKMFYLAALSASAAEGKIELEDEDHRAVKAMIATSSNDATTYLLGRLTGAFDGPPLPPDAMRDWMRQRHFVMDWLQRLQLTAFDGIHLSHSTYDDSPYGRAKQARQEQVGNRLSARACAAMIHEILRGALPGRDWMASHLSRDWQRNAYPRDEGNQVEGFLTEAIPPGFKVWSKAGHTSWTRHDVAYVEAPDGRAATVAVMTEGNAAAENAHTLPAFARAFIHEAFAKPNATKTN
ncbi:serine hydrolase [Paracoccus aurantiacus]|uniref:beta-lactamase n=1 Tax=Paracoccus aurantiacus TaxID=2599412 RepID=A0A5C6RQ94_9RHOB|nr:serine hydrolase [Paracoccus aurantiacus]TXB64085.1 serine hydrolase [Paracoccus aurantiacus]